MRLEALGPRTYQHFVRLIQSRDPINVAVSIFVRGPKITLFVDRIFLREATLEGRNVLHGLPGAQPMEFRGTSEYEQTRAHTQTQGTPT